MTKQNDIFYNDKFINTYSRICNDVATEKGWWDGEPKSYEACLTLIYSELYEFYEALREDNINNNFKIFNPYFNQEFFKKEDIPDIKESEENYLLAQFRTNCKSSGEVELADMIIRCLDWWGQYPALVRKPLPKANLNESIHKEMLKAMDRQTINYLYSFAVELANIYNISLLTPFNLKISYNKTRNYKHGNKKF